MAVHHKFMYRVLLMILVTAMLLSMSAYGVSAPTATLSDPNGQTLVENTQTENVITENELHEFITSEIYLQEIIVAEDEISELLLEEETISEVQLCTIIYVPQDHIEDFAEHSQTAQLFGDDVDISSLLKKVAVGTGVILTLVILEKIGFEDPIACMVTAAADKSLQFSAGGAAVGSLLGGLTGAVNEIDKSGRTSAVMGFAAVTAGLILSIVNLVGTVPSGGASAIGVAAGVKLVIAGISTLAMTAKTIRSGYDAVRTFQATDGEDLDWKNIDWDSVGVSSAEQAINYGADGYMWGSIVGAVYGGAEEYERYHKFSASHTEYKDRRDHTPKDGNVGHWSGERGESDFILESPLTDESGNEVLDPLGNQITKRSYHNGIPDFSDCAKAEVNIHNMTNSRYRNFVQADEALAKKWTEIKYNGQTWTARAVKTYRVENHLTWHEMSNMKSMQLVPYDVNRVFKHYGGVAEYNAMIGLQGGEIFDP